MRIFTYIIFLLTASVSFDNDQGQIDLFCHTWRQVGFMRNGDNKIKSVDKEMGKRIQFKKDGTFEEIMYNLKGKGLWEFNEDSTKFGLKMTDYNGMNVSNSLPIAKNILIIKLTADTLVYGTEAYYGKEKKYGHEDWYFIKER